MTARVPRIKFCGLTTEADVDAAVQAGADAIGFVFYPPSPRAVTPEQARALVARLPPFVTPVGLFVNEAPDTIAQTTRTARLQVIQCHGDESPADCAALELPVLKAIRLCAADTSERVLARCTAYESAVQSFLFDTDSPGFGGSGHSFNWAVVAAIQDEIPRPWVLSGGLTAQTVPEALALLAPAALDVSSGIELVDAAGQRVKGRKDPVQMQAFAQAVRAARL